jgi:wyosine [tRNA(Phe)-imidazoG37] synthetase (radical SAM superfamily)
MLVKGLNDTEEALSNIARALRRIRPDQVHLNVPVRPPAEGWVELPNNEGLIQAMMVLEKVAPIVTPAEGTFGLAKQLPVVDAIVETIRRHPMRETELIETLGRFAKQPDQVKATLEALEASGQARRHVYQGQVFWEYAGGRFAATTKQKGTSQ